MNKTNNIFNAGVFAFNNNKSFLENPYDEQDNPNYSYWANGFRSAASNYIEYIVKYSISRESLKYMRYLGSKEDPIVKDAIDFDDGKDKQMVSIIEKGI